MQTQRLKRLEVRAQYILEQLEGAMGSDVLTLEEIQSYRTELDSYHSEISASLLAARISESGLSLIQSSSLVA